MQHEYFPTCHTAEHSYCFITIHHYRYDSLYCQCSPRLRHTLTIYFALYCFFHLKQVIQNLFFLVSKYTLAISLNDFFVDKNSGFTCLEEFFLYYFLTMERTFIYHQVLCGLFQHTADIYPIISDFPCFCKIR